MTDKINVKGYERSKPRIEQKAPVKDGGIQIIGGGAVRGVVTHSRNDPSDFPTPEIQKATREKFAKVKKGTEE